MRTAGSALAIVLLLLAPAPGPQAQGTAPATTPATPLTLISTQGRRPVPTTLVSGQEFIALDDVAALFQVTVREDVQAGGITITYKGRTAVVSPDQPMASVGGRVVTLPAAAVRSGRRWLVPVTFLPRALALIYDSRIELRPASRLLLLGNVRVPRVTTRIDMAGPPTRATIEISPATPVTIAVEADRMVLRLDADAIDLAQPAASGGLIAQVRLGDPPAHVTILLSPRSGTARAIQTMADNVTRVTIDVPTAGQTDAAPPAALPGPAAAAPPAGTLTLSNTRRSAIQTVVLDPGHGGDEAGARGPTGALEKVVTLEIAQRLKMLIETRLGMQVILTRDDDRAVTLDTRSAMANNSKADLFLSLHMNAGIAASTSGAEVYFLRLDKEGEEARRIAAAQQTVLPVRGGGSRAIETIRWDLAQASHVSASGIFASMIEAELRKKAVPMGIRPVQQAPLRVLAGVNMPAALVEMGYLTNGEQEQLAQSADFQASLAQSLCDAIANFRTSLDEPRPR